MKRIVRKILLIIAVFLLAAAIPSVIREFNKTGEIYLFSKQFWDDVVSRFTGPGRFRFVIQPTVAIFLGTLGGKRDATAGRPLFFWSIIYRDAGWKEAVKDAFDTISIMLIFGVLADIVFQYILFRMVHIGSALLLGPIFITIPYAMARGASNRVFCKRQPNSTEI